jgi:DNA repair ATPase RecN
MGQLTGEMHAASAALVESHDKQRLNGIVVLAVFGALMLTSMALFGIMSYRLQSRITQADEMLLAVGKRIVAMNETMELITGAGETLRDIAARQDTIVGGQAKLDARLDEMLANAAQASAAAATAKPADPKAPDLAKLLQSLDAKLQSQSSALNALSSQVRAAPAAARPDPAAVRREVEAVLQKQKAAEAAARPVVVAPAAPPAPAPKPKEALVQYPRTPPQGKETP